MSTNKQPKDILSKDDIIEIVEVNLRSPQQNGETNEMHLTEEVNFQNNENSNNTLLSNKNEKSNAMLTQINS